MQCGKLNLARVTENKRSQVVARIADPTALQQTYLVILAIFQDIGLYKCIEGTSLTFHGQVMSSIT